MKTEDLLTIFKSENYVSREDNESLYSISNGRTGIEDLSLESLKKLRNLLTEYIGREEKLSELKA